MTVNGEGFCEESVVTITLGDDVHELETTFVDENTLTAAVPAGLALGSYDVTVTNSGDETATLAGALEIVASPMVFFVDPFTIYSGVNVQVTFYAAGILGEVSEVLIFPEDAPENTTSLVVTSAARDEAQAVVPAGLSAGSYGVTVADDRGCVGTLSPAFRVVEQTTIPLERMELPFGWTDGRGGPRL